MEGHLDGYTWSGGRLTRKQTTSRPDNVWPDLWKHMSDASIILLQDHYGKGNSRKFFWKTDGKKFLTRNAYSLTERKKGLFLSVYVDDIKMTEKKQNLDPMWKTVMKEVYLGAPTSSLDHVYVGCTQRECKISKDIVDNYRDWFESRMSAGAHGKAD